MVGILPCLLQLRLPPSLFALTFRNGMPYRHVNARINSGIMPLHRIKSW